MTIRKRKREREREMMMMMMMMMMKAKMMRGMINMKTDRGWDKKREREVIIRIEGGEDHPKSFYTQGTSSNHD